LTYKIQREIKPIFIILMIVGYVLSTWYKKELAKQKEKQINKRPVSNKTSEEIFRELQKSLQEARSGQSPKQVVLEKTPAPEPKTRHISQSHTPEAKPKRVINYTPPAPRKPMKSDAFADFRDKPKRELLKPSAFKERNKKMAENAPAEVAEDYGTPMEFDLRKAVLYSEILKRPQY
jgi:hypothetical protein